MLGLVFHQRVVDDGQVGPGHVPEHVAGAPLAPGDGEFHAGPSAQPGVGECTYTGGNPPPAVELVAMLLEQ